MVNKYIYINILCILFRSKYFVKVFCKFVSMKIKMLLVNIWNIYVYDDCVECLELINILYG